MKIKDADPIVNAVQMRMHSRSIEGIKNMVLLCYVKM